MQLESMTGFGEDSFAGPLVHCIAEIRSYNSRTLDVIVRGDAIAPDLEASIRTLIKKNLVRGRVEISFLWSYSPRGIAVLAGAQSARLKEFGKFLPSTISAECVAAMLMENDGVVSAVQLHRTARVGAARSALGKALQKVSASRKKEGRLLAKEMLNIFSRLKSNFQQIKSVVQQPKVLAGEKKVESKQDVSEELARIDVHLSSLQLCLKAQGHQGKKMEFILQELLREFTTTGSKIGKSTLSKAITLGKLEIERLREQAQNIV